MKTSSKSKGLFILLDVLFFILLVILDQITKNLAVVYLKDKPAYVIWDGVFELHYLENSGAAFGMLQNQKILFVTIASVILMIVGYVLIKLPRNKHFAMLEILLVLIASGAVGNMIDRVQFNYVVDFFYFKLIDFPIFNVADIYVSVSCVLLAILVIFFYKDDDFDFLGKKKE